ncbi:type I restriction-modification system subunit M [Microtetraspora niveoalba]|uniref:type I restriction-modification system subunit M n=1 Tax=Microtetraspora niveoalba TaxID=46175 RepID=UPI00083768BC|nr:class I SAM-dependent DNA methyltransferase [Microtetraspora niveoalba]
MDSAQYGRIVNFIWNIADDVLRDLYVRGKYRDVILPMTVLRRLDAVLEPTKAAVLEMKQILEDAGIVKDEGALCDAAKQAFFNTSPFTLRDLRSRSNHQQLKADFEAYLDGFSDNVQVILNNFEFRNQIPRLSKANALGPLIEKLMDPDINLSPDPVRDPDGRIRQPGMDNHTMGTIFEELVRRFNEENNEEAGEHWTPRDAVKLMANLVFQPVADKVSSTTYLLYDGACGTGGMLTVGQETLRQLGEEHGKQVTTHLYGQEINAETYAICKADMLLQGDGRQADNIKGGPEYSTLANDAFPSFQFDFMLSNPPYGKSWKSDMERMGGKKEIQDHRFVISYDGDPEYSLVTRSDDGQLLFLANMVSKMKQGTELGSRIASVHNGSSLFTGDAGQGESNIRRWIIANDWLEAVVALPLNMFYNTGIATFIWVLSNRKPEHRKGKVQLIDATSWYVPLRKNLGKKNCELSEADIQRIVDTLLAFEETEQSKIFPNKAFGYWKILVERPLRLASQLTRESAEQLRFASGDVELRARLHNEFGEVLFTNFTSVQREVRAHLDEWVATAEEGDDAPEVSDRSRKKLLDAKTWDRDGRLAEIAMELWKELGEEVFMDYNEFELQAGLAMGRLGKKLSATERKVMLRGLSWRNESAAPVIAKRHRPGTVEPNPLYGLYEDQIKGKSVIVEYEPDGELRDAEQVPLLEEGGIEAFFRREVQPYASDAWIKQDATKIGYEISFTRHFYKPPQLRSLEEIRADILALEQETEGILGDLLGGVRSEH